MAPFPNSLVIFPKDDLESDPVTPIGGPKEVSKFECEPLMYALLLGEAVHSPVKKGQTRSPSEILESMITLLCTRIEQSASCSPAQAERAPKDMRILLEHLAEMLHTRRQKVFGNEDVRSHLAASPELLNIWIRLRARVKSGDAPILSTLSRQDGEVQFRFSHPSLHEFLLACYQAKYWHPEHNLLGQPLEDAIFDRSWGNFFLWFFDRKEIQVTLDLRNLRMLGWKTTMLAKYLECTSGVLKLFLKSSSIGVRGTGTLCQALASNSSVQYLELEDVALGNSSTEALILGLSNNVGLRYLDLTGNQIGPPGALGIAKAVRGNTNLEHLDIKDNRIADLGTHYMARAMVDNKALRHLDLSGNHVTEEGIADLATALHENHTLKELAIRDNIIGDYAALQLARALSKTDASIQRLEMGNPAQGTKGKISINGLKNFWPLVVKSNCKFLDLASHVLGTDSIALIAKNDWGFGSLTHLDLAGNRIGGAGCTHITSMLKGNSNMIHLNLQWNDINDQGAFELCDALANCELRELVLSNNFITMDGARALVASQSRSRIKVLKLEHNKKIDHLRLKTFELGVVKQTRVKVGPEHSQNNEANDSSPDPKRDSRKSKT
jgi:Ran GTPase-activating protein (RanGAP) involved in mRNA processing and transport